MNGPSKIKQSASAHTDKTPQLCKFMKPLVGADVATMQARDTEKPGILDALLPPCITKMSQ